MIRHDSAAKHDLQLRRPSRIKRLWKFLTYKEPGEESLFEAMGAGVGLVLAIAAIWCLAALVAVGGAV